MVVCLPIVSEERPYDKIREIDLWHGIEPLGFNRIDYSHHEIRLTDAKLQITYVITSRSVVTHTVDENGDVREKLYIKTEEDITGACLSKDGCILFLVTFKPVCNDSCVYFFVTLRDQPELFRDMKIDVFAGGLICDASFKNLMIYNPDDFRYLYSIDISDLTDISN